MRIVNSASQAVEEEYTIERCAFHRCVGSSGELQMLLAVWLTHCRNERKSNEPPPQLGCSLSPHSSTVSLRIAAADHAIPVA